VYRNVPVNVELYKNRPQYGSTAAGCVVCRLCAHVWEVAAHCNLSVVCLSEGMPQAGWCTVSAWGKGQQEIHVQAREECCKNTAGLVNC